MRRKNSVFDLHTARFHLQLTQAELGAKLDMHANTIARMERSELPVPVVVRLAVQHLQCERLQKLQRLGRA